MCPRSNLHHRPQLSSETTSTSTAHHHCAPFTLPPAGHLVVNPTSTITLTTNAVFTPDCTASALASNDVPGITYGDERMKDPFNASVTPQTYATGAATVIAWMLVIMLLITPRTFFVGGAGGGLGLLGRRGMISGATGGASVIGVGSRPWLQKVAALTVAISLTIATADTFKVAERQYDAGFMNALALRDEVVASMEIRITRVISDIFIWLAQVQTLIRLFPRHKEKVMIKWIGFALIVLDSTFSCLNNFIGNPAGRPGRFVDAIPALSYLFQLALSMLYAAWVFYYAITKRRYAFYHSIMWNISLVALLSIVAVLTPVVFFITDISNASVAGWGDYFRWVGAAAASVIVWEWVERIEALEREEKKDGILGREIFDGDEMLEVTPSEEVQWPGSRIHRDQGGHGSTGPAYTTSANGHKPSAISFRLGRFRGGDPSTKPQAPPKRFHFQPIRAAPNAPTETMGRPPANNPLYAAVPTPPPAVASPVSRTDTTSAASTVYAVRYHPIGEPSPPLARRSSSSPRPHRRIPAEANLADATPPERQTDTLAEPSQEPENLHVSRKRARWQPVPNPFKRRRASPPPEILSGRVIEQAAAADDNNQNTRPQPIHNYARWDLKSRLGAFAAEQGERFRERTNGRQAVLDLPVVVIPAQPRGRTWSPDILCDVPAMPQLASGDGIRAPLGMSGGADEEVEGDGGGEVKQRRLDRDSGGGDAQPPPPQPPDPGLFEGPSRSGAPAPVSRPPISPRTTGPRSPNEPIAPLGDRAESSHHGTTDVPRL